MVILSGVDAMLHPAGTRGEPLQNLPGKVLFWFPLDAMLRPTASAWCVHAPAPVLVQTGHLWVLQEKQERLQNPS